MRPLHRHTGQSFLGLGVALIAAALSCCGGDTHSPTATPCGSCTPAGTALAAATSTPGPAPAPGRPISATDQAGLRAHERSFLPALAAVEQWHEAAVVGEPANFAPSVVRLTDGRYRMYANGGVGAGVVSFISVDGLSFSREPGERLPQPGTGTLDCVSSHPWVVPMDGGYRMYYQGDALCARGGDVRAFRIFSAFSSDGLTFVREGVRVDIGPSTGLTQAAHGRIVRLGDGRYRMYFSANFRGKDAPADVLGATSDDGLEWRLDAAPILERAHDPTVIAGDGAIWLYTTFLGDNFVALRSSDGFTFTPMTWLDFESQAGQRIEEFGDADITRLEDGRLVIYGSGKGSRGVSVMLK